MKCTGFSPDPLKPLGPFVLFLLLVLATSFGSCSCNEAAGWFQNAFLESEVHGARRIVPTPVASPSSPTLNFLALGDAGTGGPGQRRVAHSMAEKAEGDTAAFVLFLGDNFYESGVSSASDPQWERKFESVYWQPSLQIPFLAVLGNHDYYLNPDAQVEYTERSKRWYMPERYYTRSFEVDDSTDLQIFCLDTAPLSSAERSVTPPTQIQQLRWLDSSLAASMAHWKIVAGHHTIYSNGEHGDNPYLASLLEPIFRRHGVDLYLCGHDHDLQLLKPVNGIHYVVSGGGGKHRDTWWRDNTMFAATNLGFAFFRVSHSAIIVEFFDADGSLQFASSLPKRPYENP